MALNTPFAFYAAAGAAPLPTVYTGSQFYYDSNQTSTFTDQTTNGNDGTITVGGSGGGSSITHIASAGGNYWDFVASNPASEQSYVNTGTNIGSVTNWSLMIIVADTDLGTNSQFFRASDGGSDNLELFTNRSNNNFFLRASDGTRRDIQNTAATLNQLYFIIGRYDDTAASEEMEMLINNSSVGTNANAQNIDVTATTYLGLNFPNLTTTNEFRLGAVGFWQNYYLTDTDCTNLFDYYAGIYTDF